MMSKETRYSLHPQYFYLNARIVSEIHAPPKYTKETLLTLFYTYQYVFRNLFCAIIC